MNDIKYVNRADVTNIAGARRPQPRRPSVEGYDAQSVALIELIFFAYRDFIQTPDVILESHGFGRAHHRVLHFVNRHPGLSVAELLDILKITKQSLARVLRDLVDDGFVEQREGSRDRRKRLLYATAKGRDLSLDLATLQSRRINAALEGLAPDARDIAKAFLFRMIDAADRPAVERLIGEPKLAAAGRGAS